MDSASPARAGIGRKTARDAASVAKTASADFDFKRDFAETPASKPFGTRFGGRFETGQTGPASPPGRHRGAGHPTAPGDGHA